MDPFEKSTHEIPAAGLPEGLSARALRRNDLDQAILLSQEAGWNQLPADWEIFTELGLAIAVLDGDRIVATAAMLPYGGRFAWISMVLVTAAYRRRGLASWLLRYCVARLVHDGLVPVLDATPAGREVYLRLGFRDAWAMHRLVLERRHDRPSFDCPHDVAVRPLTHSDWPAIVAYDGAVFGAERERLLRGLARRLPHAALVAERAGRMSGFLLGRDGHRMTQIGPLCADDVAVARALLAHALADLAPPLAVDLPDRHHALGAWLSELGFRAERPLTRMVHQRPAAFDDTARLFAVAGPELG